MTLQPRVVLVHRRSEYDELVARHGTRQQAAFFLDQRGRSLDDLEAARDALAAATRAATAAVPTEWRRAEVERGDLARFVFGPEDVIVVVGQDGLVANVAKYLDGQPVVGINPDPGRNPGVLIDHACIDAAPAQFVCQHQSARSASHDQHRCLLRQIHRVRLPSKRMIGR